MIRHQVQADRLGSSPSRTTAARSVYGVGISEDVIDPRWDDFLVRVPGVHRAQSSLWASAKAYLGWSAVRVVASDHEGIRGGAQMLIRKLPIYGYAGYIPWGPVISREDPALVRLVMDSVMRVARSRGVQYLAVRPPSLPGDLPAEFDRIGLRQSPIQLEVEPEATTVVDLRQSEEEILAGMESKTRYNVRVALRKGVLVREGSEDDLPEFHRLLLLTSQRQAFSIHDLGYFSTVWHALAPREHMKLFLAEVHGEVVSGLLAIPFGDTVTYWRGAWDGRYGNLHPNEAMQWAAMLWAKSSGYRHYDFEGIDPAIARSILAGESAPKGRPHPLTSFKLGFGGEVVLFPGLFDYVPNPILRWGYTNVFRLVARQPAVISLINVVRGIRS